ncbi:MFS general substrate transporter [Penicillium longicatenatum]|nr:MFS general substrate transporter [Penicillium longicatenatum]
MNSRPASILMRETNVSRKARNFQPKDSSSQGNPAVDDEDEVEVQYITGVKLALIILAVIGAALLVMFDMSIIATAIPKITSDFHSTVGVGWYGSAYLLTSCTLQPITGKLYARFNVKYTYIAFIVLFELGSLVCGVSTSSNMFIVGRAIAGMGSSGIQNGAMTILSASIPLEKRALYFGIVGSFLRSSFDLILILVGGQIGVVISPLIGGVLTEYATWRWCFYINLPIGGLAVLALLFISIPEHSLSRPEQQPETKFASLFSDLDIIGFLLLGPTLVMFLLALEWGGTTYPWNDTMVISLFCGSAGNLALFFGWEYNKGDAAIFPWKIIKQRVISSSSLTMFFLYANSLISSYYLAIYFQGVRGESPMFSGVYTLPGVIAQMASGLTSGLAGMYRRPVLPHDWVINAYKVTRLGYYLPSAVTGTVLSAIGSGLMSLFTPHTSTATWIGYQIIAGVGRGCAVQMPLIAVQNNIPPSKIATFGGALWLSFASTVFNTGLENLLPIYAPDIPVAEVTSAGVSRMRSVIPHSSLEGVVLAYNDAVQHVFYMVAGTATAAFIFSWGLGWKSVKKGRA